MKIWLSPEVLNWEITTLRNSTERGGDNDKPYIFLNYTKKRFREVHKYGTVDEENLVLNDIIINLRQALEHREERLHEKFKFSQLSFAKPKRYEHLEQFYIVQPIFANKLRKLRNKVIHEQKIPLGREEKDIEELWEFAWYFLRATDVFLARFIEGVLYFPPETETIPVPIYSQTGMLQAEKGYLYLEGFEPDWNIRIEGKGIPAKLFSVDKKKDWIELDGLIEFNLPVKVNLDEAIEKVLAGEVITETEADKKERIGNSLKSCEPVFFEGEVIGPDDKVEKIVKEYLALYVF